MPQRNRPASPSGKDGLAVIVTAAGLGTRLGYGLPKALVPVAGRPILERALSGVTAAWPRAHVMVTVPPGDTRLTAFARSRGAHPVVGGTTRAQSVARALASLPAGTRWVAVHDAARCLVPAPVFATVASALAAGERAVVPVLPVADTIRGVDTLQRSTGTVPRAGLRAAQTPQAFETDLLLEVNRCAGLLPGGDAGAHAGRGARDPEGITDDASLVELFRPDVAVRLVAGHEESFKITRPLDLVLATALARGGTGGEDGGHET